MRVERVDAFIKSDDLVTVTPMGHIVEIQYLKAMNRRANIKKLSKTMYLELSTGEVKEFSRSATRKDNVNSLRQTFKKLAYLINANFHGKRNELFLTLTYEENVCDLKRVGRDLDVFLKRLKRFVQKKFDVCDIEHIAVKEPQQRGAWHFHILLKFPTLKRVYISNDEVSLLWGNGFVNVKSTAKMGNNLGAYLCAYLSDLEITDEELQDQNYLKMVADWEGVQGIQSTKKDENKRVIKGGRLHLYPVGMNIFSRSKGMKYPERKIMTYTSARSNLNLLNQNLTMRKSIEICDEATNFENVIVFEQYNKKNDGDGGILGKLEKNHKNLMRVEESSWIKDILLREKFELENKFYLQKLKRDYLKRIRSKFV